MELRSATSTQSTNNPNKINKLQQITSNYKNINTYNKLAAVSIFVGIFLKLIFRSTTKDNFTLSVLSGFSFLSRNYLMTAFCINFLFLINILAILIYDYFNNKGETNESFFLKPILNLRICYIFKSLFIWVYFVYILYGNFIVPVYDLSKFKISGHFACAMLGNLLLLNVKNIAEYLESKRIRTKIMRIYSYLIVFLVLHNLWTIIFTCWLYHSVLEATAGYLIGVINAYILNLIEIDSLIIALISPRIDIHIKAEDNICPLKIVK